MFGLGMPELLIILVIALLVFGAGRLPEIGSSLGRAIRGFKESSEAPESPREEIDKGRTCPQCGKAAPPEVAFCSHCGGKFPTGT